MKAATMRTRAAPFSRRARSVFVYRMSIEYPLNLCAKISQTEGLAATSHTNVMNNGHLESFHVGIHPLNSLIFCFLRQGAFATKLSNTFGP